MIDESLAKGLTKRFLDEYHEQSLNKIVQFRPSPKDMRSRATWSKFVKKFKAFENTWAIHAAEYGSKRKPNFGFMTLVRSDYNALKGWDESMLRFMRWDFSFHHGKGTDRDLPLALSHHAIQRVFQRSDFSRETAFREAFTFFKRQFAYIPFWYAFFIGLCITDQELDRAASGKTISIPLPSKSGLFLCDFTLPVEYELPRCDVRTFIGSHQLSDAQLHLLKLMTSIANSYSSLPFMYLMGSPFPTIREPCLNASAAEGLESVFMLEAIVVRKFDELLEIIQAVKSENKSRQLAVDLFEKNVLKLKELASDEKDFANILSKNDPAIWQKLISYYWQVKHSKK